MARGYLPLSSHSKLSFYFSNLLWRSDATRACQLKWSANPLPIQPPLLAPLLTIMILICAPPPLLKRSLLLLTQTELLLQPSECAALLFHFLAVLGHHCHVRHNAHAHRAGCSSTGPKIRRRRRGAEAEVRRGGVGVEVIYVCGGCGPRSLKRRIRGGLDWSEELLVGAR